MLPISNDQTSSCFFIPLVSREGSKDGCTREFQKCGSNDSVRFLNLYFFLSFFYRDSIEMETRNDTNWTYPREKAHQTLIDRPISECGTEMRGFLRFV